MFFIRVFDKIVNLSPTYPQVQWQIQSDVVLGKTKVIFSGFFYSAWGDVNIAPTYLHGRWRIQNYVVLGWFILMNKCLDRILTVKRLLAYSQIGSLSFVCFVAEGILFDRVLAI